MKTSNSSVLISGIDVVEKGFSYPYPAVKQMGYQVEVFGTWLHLPLDHFQQQITAGDPTPPQMTVWRIAKVSEPS
jgi:hypothetical protein